jgi:hypothetical protein
MSMNLVCLGPALSDVIHEVRSAYEQFIRLSDSLHLSVDRFLTDTGALRSELHSPSISQSTRLSADILTTILDAVVGSLPYQLRLFADHKDRLRASMALFEAIAGSWLKRGSELNSQIHSSLKALQNTTRSPISTCTDHEYYAQVLAGLRLQFEEAGSFLNGALAEAQRHSIELAAHMGALHYDFAPMAEPVAIPLVPEGPMAVKLRAEMKKELDIGRVIELFAMAVMPPVLPGIHGNRVLLDYFAIENFCEKPITGKIKAPASACKVGKSGDSEEVIQLSKGQVVTVREGGYGPQWEVEIKGRGRFWVESRMITFSL